MDRAVVVRQAGLRLAIVAAILLLLVGLFAANQNWNHPASVEEAWPRIVRVTGVPVLVEVKCKCPPYVLQSVPGTITFEISARLPNGQNVLGAPVAQTTSALLSSELSVWATTDDQRVTFPDGSDAEPLVQGSDLNANPPTVRTVRIPLNATAGSVNLTFHVAATKPGDPSHFDPNDGEVSVDILAKPTFLRLILPYAIVLLVLAGITGFVYRTVRSAYAKSDKAVAAARELAEKNPNHSKYAWQLARTRLEAYLDKNLLQVNLVFWLSVAVMTAGFLVVLWGVTGAANSGSAQTSGSISPSQIATIAGVITQFLGATFLVIFRSTMTQAGEFVGLLDRINNVEMAIEVLDQIPDQPPDPKNEVRAKIIDHLLEAGRTSHT